MNTSDFDPLTLTIFMAGLALVPLLLMITTSFLKIAVVLMIVRNALGVQQVPPNMVLYGIAMALSIYIMAPVFELTRQNFTDVDLQNIAAQDITTILKTGTKPIQEFMLAHSSPDTRELFVTTAEMLWEKSPTLKGSITEENPLALIPAFVVSELQAGFEIGFLIYIPFVVIDLLVSNLLLALGMQMVAPMTVSLPLKILLFILVSGWEKLLHSLVLTYM